MIHVRIRCAMLIFALIVIANVGNADPGKPIPRANQWALLFGVNDNFSIGRLSGSTAAIMVHVTPRLALRFDVSLSAQKISDENSITDWSAALTKDFDIQTSQIRTEFYLHALRYRLSESPFKLYFGAGPYWGVYNNRIQRKTDNISETNSDLRLGISGLLGVEWFAHEYVGIFGEYQSVAAYIHQKTVRDDTQNTNVDSEYRKQGVQLFASRVKVGLAIYF